MYGGAGFIPARRGTTRLVPQNVIILEKSLFLPIPKDSALYTTRIKYYGDDYTKIACFNRPVFNGDGLEIHKTNKQLVDNDSSSEHFQTINSSQIPQDIRKLFDSHYKDRSERTDSIKRAKDKAFEIAYANEFDYFITITIDEEKLHRTDTKAILKKVRPLWSNLVQRKDFKYIFIPEYHERYEVDGKRAIHFHGLASGDLKMINSGKVFKGQPIYNWSDWRYGFSTAVKLDKRKFICQYITKYITKDNEKIFGKHYFSGGKLNRTVPTVYCNTNFDEFDGKAIEILGSHLQVKYQTIDNR